MLLGDKAHMKKLLKSLVLVAAVGAIATPAVYASESSLSRFSLSGFADMSIVDDDNGRSGGLDQFELNLGYDFGSGLTAMVDVDYQDDGNLEQAYITYAASDSVSIRAGRFLSYSGFEDAEPTGLYQYSTTGYEGYFYGGYQQGVSLYSAGESLDFAVSVISDLVDPKGKKPEEGSAYEAMLAYHPTDSLTLKGTYMIDENEVDAVKMTNIWGSYSEEGLTLATEFSSSENTDAAAEISGVEAEGRLVMVNYAWDVHGVTVRYHETEVTGADGKTAVEDKAAITLAYSRAITDNLSVITEYRFDDDNLADDFSDTFALEALVTF
jgi:hypothetical protein